MGSVKAEWRAALGWVSKGGGGEEEEETDP